MPFSEDVKKIVEQFTGFKRPSLRQIKRRSTARPYHRRFRQSGLTPNNPSLPFLHYKSVVTFEDRFDPAAAFEVLFAANGWKDSWRDSVYEFLHFHTMTHEVLGFARGRATIQFGGKGGRTLDVKAGDVVVMPAGTGHQRRRGSNDLLVVGAYPAGGKYDEPRPGDVTVEQALKRIEAVPLPRKDPVFGVRGPLRQLWQPQ